MDYSQYKNFKHGALILVLAMMSACSSSKNLGESAAPVETVADAQSAPMEASTDPVPAPEPVAESKVPDALDATPSAQEMAPGVEVADAPPLQIQEDSNTVAPITEVPAEPITDQAVANSDEGVRYRVKKGDTLMKIAFENYGDLYRWKEIYEANRDQIQDPNHVPPGTQLTLNGAGMVTIERNGDRYLIKHGDTLGLISKDVYGTTRQWKRLWENNRQLIKNPNRIYAGFYLYYQPEGRLTGEQEASPSASVDVPTAADASAALTQDVNVGKTVANNDVQVAPAAPVQAPEAARTPASNK